MALNSSTNVVNLELVDNDGIVFTGTGRGTKGDPLVIEATVQTDGSVQVTPSGLSVSLDVAPTGGDNCLNLTLAGDGTPSAPITVDGNVIISSNAANTLVCDSDGLAAIVGFSAGSMSDCLTVGLTGDGSADAPFDLQADLVLGSLPDNLLTCTPGGLHAALEYNYSHGNCVDLSVTGFGTLTDPLCIHSDVNISQLDGNTLKCAQDGLFVGAYGLYAQSTPNFEIKVTGSGDHCDPWVLWPEIKISDDPSNQLKSTGAGLLVRPDHIVGGTTEGMRIDVDGTGTTTDPYKVTGNPTVAPVANNILELNSDGLFVPDFSHTVYKDTDLLSWVITGTGTAADPEVVCPVLNLAGITAGTTGGGTTTGGSTTGGSTTGGSTTGGSTTGGSTTGGSTTNNIDNGLLVVTTNGLMVVPTVIEVSPTCGTGGIATTITGTGTPTDPYLLCSNATLDPDTDNLLTITANGLMVEPQTIVNGSVMGVFDGDPTFECVNGQVFFRVSTDPCNQIVTGSDGRPYVAPVCVNNKDAKGVLLDVDANNCITAQLFIDGTNPNNIVEINNNGIYVSGYVAVDTPTIDLNVDASNNISADIKISAAPNNGVSVLGDGLFAENRKFSEFELGIGGCVAEQLYDMMAYVPSRDIEVDRFSWYLGTAPVGADLAVQIVVNGLPVHTVTVPQGTPNQSSGYSVFNTPIALSAGDNVRLNVLSAGVPPAEDLQLYFSYAW